MSECDYKLDTKEIVSKRGGLFGTKSKIPIQSKSTLGMIHSPGVGHVTEEICQNPDASETLTNKTNSMFILTDGTGFNTYDRHSWNPDCAIPYLEAKSLYYKSIANIDCYP